MVDTDWSKISERIASSDMSDSPADETAFQPARHTVDAIVEELFPDESFQFDPSLVGGSLEEVLLMFIMSRTEVPTGRCLVEDVTEVFGSNYEPEVVYHTLHELDDTGLIETKDTADRREYHIADSERAQHRIAKQMRQNLGIGCVLFHTLENH